MKVVNIRLTKSMLAEVDRQAKNSPYLRSEFLRRLIEKGLKDGHK